MLKSLRSNGIKTAVVSIVILITLAFVASVSFAGETITSAPFKGVKVNGGTVTLTKEGDKTVLTLSDDFVVPRPPILTGR